MLTRYKEDFGELMLDANLSDHEFVILAKKMGLDGEPIEPKTLAKMLGLSESLVSSIAKRAMYKVKMIAGRGEFDALVEKLTAEP